MSDTQRQKMLEDFKSEFSYELLLNENSPFSFYRKDVTTYNFCPLDAGPSRETKLEMRDWLECRGWLFSRQFRPDPCNPGQKIEYIFIAPILRVELVYGFHATRQCSVASILREGLNPSTEETKTTDRADCEGNIYVTESLGKPEDAGIPGSKSAHWWRDHLARHNRFNDSNWAILEVDLRAIPPERIYRDLWSESGIIVRPEQVIPATNIRQVWPVEC